VKTNRNFLSAADRADLVKIVRDGLEEHRIVRRANAILLLDKGWSYAEVAEALFLDDSTIRIWLKEFQEGGVEAIVSRCIALIKFHPPNDEARRKIWTVMTEQFGLAVDASLLDALVAVFPTTSGRDIKGLAKLVAKYCHHRKVPPTLEVFERCAIFRGIDLAAPASA